MPKHPKYVCEDLIASHCYIWENVDSPTAILPNVISPTAVYLIVASPTDILTNVSPSLSRKVKKGETCMSGGLVGSV